MIPSSLENLWIVPGREDPKFSKKFKDVPEREGPKLSGKFEYGLRKGKF